MSYWSDSDIAYALDVIAKLESENDELRQLFLDFWTWVAPPFGINGGSLDEYVSILERIDELGFESIWGSKSDRASGNENLEHAMAEFHLMKSEVTQLRSENAKLRELVGHYDSALARLCDQAQGHVECGDCVLGAGRVEDVCALDELRESARGLRVEVDS